MAHNTEINSFDQFTSPRRSFLSNISNNTHYQRNNTINMELVFESDDSKDSNEENANDNSKENNEGKSKESNQSNINSSISIRELFIEHSQIISPSTMHPLLDNGEQFKLGLSHCASAIQLNLADYFKSSPLFRQLDLCCIYGNRMLGNITDEGMDFDSEEGRSLCEKVLKQIENLFHLLKLKEEDRSYRSLFPEEYQELFENDSLCYLPEILDSAQDDTSYYFLNGETFFFTEEVIQCGNDLYKSFYSLLEKLNEFLLKIKEEFLYSGIKEIKSKMSSLLMEFDRKWVKYEEKIIKEIINIERKSRRLIYEGIKVEKELTHYELRSNVRGKILYDDIEYNKIREQFIKIISELNTVANTEGKGRDDLNIDILLKAERVLRQVSDSKSKGMRKLAESIKTSLFGLRELFRQYSQCFEGVNPQLKYNKELVDALYEFEVNWEKGKEYLMDQSKYHQLLSFSQTIEVLKEKYFRYQISELIDSSDPTIFLSLPSIIILQSLSESKQLEMVNEYIPNLLSPNEENEHLYTQLTTVKSTIDNQVHDPYFTYNLLEKYILFDNTRDQEIIDSEIEKYIQMSQLEQFKKNIKILSIQLQRYKPSEWNKFFQLAMDIV